MTSTIPIMSYLYHPYHVIPLPSLSRYDLYHPYHVMTSTIPIMSYLYHPYHVIPLPSLSCHTSTIPIMSCHTSTIPIMSYLYHPYHVMSYLYHPYHVIPLPSLSCHAVVSLFFFQSLNQQFLLFFQSLNRQFLLFFFQYVGRVCSKTVTFCCCFSMPFFKKAARSTLHLLRTQCTAASSVQSGNKVRFSFPKKKC